MVDIRPLRGVRFDPRLSGPVGPLIAPPYDVASELAATAVFSIRNVEAVDLGGNGNDHALAAERYGEWLDGGVLVRDDEPAMYLHRHSFAHNGSPVLRTGLLARVRLTDWDDRIVLPHERTTPGPRNERRERLRAVRANLSPLYFLYRDPDGVIRDLIAHHADGLPSLDGLDQMGGRHSLLPVTDAAFQERLAQIFADRTLFVADGHHRYEAALAYRNELRELNGEDAESPTEFVLALLAAVEDPGVVVRPTHRLLVGAETISPESMLATMRQWFDVRAAEATMLRRSAGFTCRLILPGNNGVWDLYSLPGRPHLDLVPQDRGPAWRSLGIVAVHAVIESLVGTKAQADVPRLVPVVDEADAVHRVENDQGQAAFLLPAPSLDRLLAVAEQGDLLPPKSTWFEPKAPAGLVINDLSDG